MMLTRQRDLLGSQSRALVRLPLLLQLRACLFVHLLITRLCERRAAEAVALEVHIDYTSSLLLAWQAQTQKNGVGRRATCVVCVHSLGGQCVCGSVCVCVCVCVCVRGLKLAANSPASHTN